jgi:hypothetical protein
MPPLNIRSELVYENKKLNNLRASIESEFVSEQKTIQINLLMYIFLQLKNLRL